MSLKKKKGSSLITVLLIFAILSISGLSVLSLTVTDYNLRMTASKKTQSLYASDSGLNVVYGIMKKVISQAIQKGNGAAEDYMTAFSLYSSTNIDPLDGLYSYLYSPDGSLDANLLKLKLNDVFRISYKSYVSNYITSPDNYIEAGKYIDLANNINSLYDTVIIPTIKVTGKENGFIGNPNQWRINIASEFLTTPISGQTSNKKIVTADIIISIPNYQDSYYVETKKQEVSINPVWKNAISIDGDMNVDSDITVNGDIYVKGTPPVVSDVNSENVKTKYNGGIAIGLDDTNEITANFNQNVVTSNSFNISGQNKTVNVAGNIYAGNVYIGKSSSAVTTVASSCFLTVHDITTVHDPNNVKGMVYTSNDLSLYATKSQINIDKYYGVNDMSGARAIDKDYNSSSSIIVNTDDIGIENGSSIHIGDAIINGTAYINTATAYQTGESVSIKGNYIAYTTPIPASTGTPYDEDIVEFVYNDPLQLVNNFKVSDTHLTGANLSGVDKAEYFKKIDELNPAVLNKMGIAIDNLIFSAGMALDNGTLVTTDVSGQGDVISKQNDFARLVYEMGDQTHLGVPMTGSTSNMLNIDYLQGKVYKTVFDGVWEANRDSRGYQINPIAQATLSNVDDSKVYDSTNNEVEVRTKNKNVVLLGANPSYIPNATQNEVIDLTAMNGAPHGIIITTKNVVLLGTVNFAGTIIAGGNLITDNVGLKTLTYDDNYVLKAIARDYTNTYSRVFNGNIGIGTQIVEVASKAGKNTGGTSSTIDGGLVKLNNWRVNN